MGACNGKSETSTSTEPNKSESAEANEIEKIKNIGSQQPQNGDDSQQEGVCKRRSHDLVCLSWGESMLSFMMLIIGFRITLLSHESIATKLTFCFYATLKWYTKTVLIHFFAIDLKTGSLLFFLFNEFPHKKFRFALV